MHASRLETGRHIINKLPDRHGMRDGFLRHPGEEYQKGIRIMTVSNVRRIASAAQQKILPIREKSFGEGISY